jgi:uncharacterized protein YgiM (DUF1202 family)
MKKILILAVASVFVFGATAERRMDLMETAVVKLISQQRANTELLKKLTEKVNGNSKKLLKLNKKTDISPLHFYAEVTSYGLNIRKKPTVKSPVIDKLTKGDKALILNTVNDKKENLWYEISNGLTKGFVSAAFTKLYVFKGGKAPFIIKRNKRKIKKTVKKEVKIKQNIKKTNKTVVKLVNTDNKKPETTKKERK